MIGKELLSEVFDFECEINDEHTLNSNELGIYSYETEFVHIINIYELAHKCKEWALTKGHILYSGCDKEEAYCYVISCPECYHLFDIHADTEPEAIFRACEWILESKRGA